MTFESFDASGSPLTCPHTPSQVLGLSRSLEVFGRQLAGSSGGVVGGVTWQQYTLDMCVEVSTAALSVPLVAPVCVGVTACLS